jgi:hypothetical protein
MKQSKDKKQWRYQMVQQALETGIKPTARAFHTKCDETIRGHVFCSFLALVLRKELEQALEKSNERFEWEDIKRDLKALQETTIEDQGKRLTVRSQTQGCCGKVFAAVGVALPVTIRSA